MTPIRRIISLVLAILLIVAGAVAVAYLFFYGAHVRAWMVAAAGMMLVVGAMWLYSDFIDATPNELRNEKDDRTP